MKMNPVNWFEIYVDDMPRAKAFYETLFVLPPIIRTPFKADTITQYHAAART